MLLQSTQSIEPFFSNDPIGFIKVIAAFIVGMSPIALVVVYFLKRGPDAAIAAVKSEHDKELAAIKKDLNGMGEKVDRMDKDREKDREAVLALHREVANNQTQLVSMVHGVAVTVARLEERGNVGSDVKEAFERYGDRITAALTERERERK